MHPHRLTIVVVVSIILGPAVTAGADKNEPPVFERDVRPILKTYCLDCHGGGAELKGKLDLRLARTARRGGKSGPAIVVGQPEESLLMNRIQDGEMPPSEKKVPPAQVAIIERWITAGARTLREEPESLPPGIDITPEERAYWAFQPIGRPDPPQVQPRARARVRTPIDAFLLANLRVRGASFAVEEDKLTLLRRASFDLIGLPPSREQVERLPRGRRP